MISKWYELKQKATSLRKKGASIRDIEIKLGIPRSTLSGWFKDIKLDKEKAEALHQNWLNALVAAREKAVTWHNQQKENRVTLAQEGAIKTMSMIDVSSKYTMELALAMLYLGEGFKKSPTTGIGNSDPLILIFFINLLKNLYGIKTEDLRCHLHIRADQNDETLRDFWSKTLGLPKENFGKTSVDKRTVGSVSYESYNGVCVIRCGNVAIQRKLVYLSKIYCEKIITSMGG